MRGQATTLVLSEGTNTSGQPYRTLTGVFQGKGGPALLSVEAPLSKWNHTDVVAFALEMFGVPMSMYVLTWVLGHTLPDRVLWGHTLIKYFGLSLTNIGIAIQIIGGITVILGWKEIYRQYWSKEQGQGQLVTRGIYHYIRHPQYTGFMLITFGMICEWATLPLLIMWPILALLYYKLARKEEADMEKEFGSSYLEYKQRTGMFLPRLSTRRTARA